MANASSTTVEKHPVHEELAGYEGAKLGMWLFLATELLLFGVLFALFAIFHAKYVEEFKLAHHSLNKIMGGLNTIILILSSLTVALGLDAVQRGKRKRANALLFATILFASGFLVVKYFEYSEKFHHGIRPGNAPMIVVDDATHEFVPSRTRDEENKIGEDGKKIGPMIVHGHPIRRAGLDLFFTFYFIMTGVHGLHVLIGMTVLAIVLRKNMQGRYTHWYYTPVENGALYWHLVDLIWIYLFPLFYLIK